jgi:hypothetical protein
VRSRVSATKSLEPAFQWLSTLSPGAGIRAIWSVAARCPRAIIVSVEARTDDDPAFDGLSDEERAWVRHDAELWSGAHAIARGRPDLDIGDVHHALRALELTASERLRRGLERVRLRSDAG